MYYFTFKIICKNWASCNLSAFMLFMIAMFFLNHFTLVPLLKLLLSEKYSILFYIYLLMT